MNEAQTLDHATAEAGWEVRQDETSGQVYYWNSITGETSWEPPPHLAREVSTIGGIAPPWTQAYDDSGRVYYLNTETMETRWTSPPSAGEPREEEEGVITSNSDVLAMTGGRGRRPSTAEQMDELNKLLSGEDGDEGGEEEEDPPEGDGSTADLGAASEMPSTVSNQAAPSNKEKDGESCPWMMFVNEDDGVPYYYNHFTGECLWDPPEEFLRFHQEHQEDQVQEQPQLGKMDETGAIGGDSNILTANAKTEDTQAQEEPSNSRSKSGSRANSARPNSATVQVDITPEFEEKVRQAIAAASNTPVGTSRLTLVHTPTPQQLAPRTGRSTGGSTSARSIPNSGRPRSGDSRPSSGGIVSRPRTPGGGGASSRVYSNPPAEDVLSTYQEEVSASTAEDDPQYDLAVGPGENSPFANEEDATEDQFRHGTEVPAEEYGAEVDNYEQPTVSTWITDEAETITIEADSRSLFSEKTVLITELGVQLETAEAEVALGNEADDPPDGSLAAMEAPFDNESDNQPEPVTAEITLDNEAGGFEAANDPAADSQALSDVTEEVNSTTGVAVDTEAAEEEAMDAYSQKVNATEFAALTLQCMARCFIARQRVKRRRAEQHNPAPPDTLGLLPETTMDGVVVGPMLEEEHENALVPLTSRGQAEEKDPPKDADPSPPLQAEKTLRKVDNSPIMPSLNADREAPLPTLPTEGREFGGSFEPQASARSTVMSVQSSRKNITSPAQEQRPRRDPASVSTRLPSVLDVARYFPPRCNHPSSRTPAGNSADPTEPVAITRKKVEHGSPPRRRRSSHQEAEKLQAELEARRKEEERVQRAQVVEYQRIWEESRRAFEAEKQRLLAEKLERDNQRNHNIAEEKRTRIQAQRERDAKRSRGNIPGSEGDRLVWEHLKTQGRPTEQRVAQFRSALSQALDAAEFPNKMCAERARELHERIDRLHRTSWALDSQLESVELGLLSELHPLTSHQRPLQAKYAANLRRRLESMINMVQSWQRVLDEWEASKENGSTSRYWDAIKSRYDPSSAAFTDEETRRHYVLSAWRGAVGGDSLLHVAAWNGWEEHVRLLADEGADVNAVDSSASHRTPLHEACRAGHARVVELLLRSGARLSAVDVSGDSPLHLACRGGWTRVVRILLMAANDLGDDADQHSLTLEDFFNLRNGKGRRAMEVATLPSLVEELENYDYQLNGAQQSNGGKHKHGRS